MVIGRNGDPRTNELFHCARVLDLGAERLQRLGAVRYAVRPFDRDMLEPLLPFRFLLGGQRGHGILHVVAAPLPGSLRDFGELARHQQVGMLVDRGFGLGGSES